MSNDQRSLTDQMIDLIKVGDQAKLYDATDWVRRLFPWPMAGVPNLRTRPRKIDHSDPQHDPWSCPDCPGGLNE